MELGFDVDQVKLNDVVQSIGKLNFNSVLAGLGIAGLVESLKQIMEVGAGLTEPLYRFNQETGLSAQKMQQWTEYAQLFGASADVVASSLSGIQKKQAALKFGDTSLLSGIYMLQQAGAKINESDLKDPFSFLEKARLGLQEINPELKTYVAGLLGLDNQVLLVKNSFYNSKDLPAPTTEQIEAIRRYSAAWTMVGIELKQLAVDIAASLSPGLKELGADIVFWQEKLHSVKDYIAPVTEAVWGLVAAVLALTSGTPLGLLVTALIEIALHADIIGKEFQDIYNWMQKIKTYFSPEKGLDRKNAINNAVDSFVHVTGASLGKTASSAQTTVNNSISIVAHNIEDLEHKVAAFFEKTIAKSFYQNSQNY